MSTQFGQQLLPSDAAGFVMGSDSPIPRFQPTNQMEPGTEFDVVTFMVAVMSVAGTPTTWSLGCKFQYCIPHTANSFKTYPVWFDLQPENVTTNVVEGVGWYGAAHTKPVGGASGIIAGSGDTLPIVVQRSIRYFGLRVRLMFDPQTTGGTNPAIKTSIWMHGKGS
jgi:hypothetical protein